MSYKQLFKIGEFSRLMHVTVKTLRHYEQKGLLAPAEVDEWTGYRYYTLDQMQRLGTILDLKALGFSLEEIRDLFEVGSHVPDIDLLSAKIRDTERQLRLLVRRRERLLQWRESRKKLDTMEQFTIQSLPEIIVASHREIIPDYEALGPMLVNKVAPEMQRLGCKCPLPGYCFTIEHNKEYTPTDVDIEYCEQVEVAFEGSTVVQCKTIPAVPMALCMKHYGAYERFYASYIEAFRYIEEHGYKVAGQPRTAYVDGIWNQEDPAKWLSIIQIPVRKV